MSTAVVPLCLTMNSDGNEPIFLSYTPNDSNNIFTMNFYVSKQYYDSNTDRSNPYKFYYDINNIKEGQWVAGVEGGYAWKIIKSPVLKYDDFGNNYVTLTLEDIDNFCYHLDKRKSNGSTIPYGNYILFEI